MPSSVCAQMVATSARLPLVIHIFVPLITQSPSAPGPDRRARVRIPAGFEPKSASVSPKQPMASPDASRGSHCCFCSSDPKRWIEYIDSEPCTDTKLRKPLSPASNSMHANP